MTQDEDGAAQMRVRPLIESDLPGAMTIIGGTGLFPPDMLPDMAGAYLRGEGDERWLAGEWEGRLTGIAYYVPERLTDGTWNLLLIAVDPDCQGAGFGSALLAAVERDLESTGQRLLIVETSGLPGYAATRAFYARAGYDEEARIRDFYQAGEDKIVFRRSLKPG